MTEIIGGELKFNELSKNSKGGTEQMAMRIHRDIDEGLLKRSHIIFSRVRPENLTKDLKNYYYLHDLPNDPESQHLKDPESIKRFEKLIFVSEWQKQQYQNYYNLPPSKCKVMLNAIEPIEVSSKKFDGTVRLIYHTTPHRGLDILYNVFNHLYNNVTKNIHLDVFSSFGVYGWAQRDEPYKELFKALEDHPGVTYHGAKPNDEVRKALLDSHIFAYPCVWPETSCIAAIEAMSAANLIVHPNFAALPETTAKLAMMYDMHEDRNAIANVFANKLLSAINLVASQSQKYVNDITYQKMYCDKTYDWNKRLREWDEFLRLEHFY